MDFSTCLQKPTAVTKASINYFNYYCIVLLSQLLLLLKGNTAFLIQ
jgi:hypothetical protein